MSPVVTVDGYEDTPTQAESDERDFLDVSEKLAAHEEAGIALEVRARIEQYTCDLHVWAERVLGQKSPEAIQKEFDDSMRKAWVDLHKLRDHALAVIRQTRKTRDTAIKVFCRQFRLVDGDSA